MQWEFLTFLIPGNATVAGIHWLCTYRYRGMPIKEAMSHWETQSFSFPLYVPLPATNFSDSLGIKRFRNFTVTSQNR